MTHKPCMQVKTLACTKAVQCIGCVKLPACSAVMIDCRTHITNFFFYVLKKETFKDEDSLHCFFYNYPDP